MPAEPERYQIGANCPYDADTAGSHVGRRQVAGGNAHSGGKALTDQVDSRVGILACRRRDWLPGGSIGQEAECSVSLR